MVRVAVERWTQVTPKSEEVKMEPPPSITAVWYWPVPLNEMLNQLRFASDILGVHVTPKSDDVYMNPLFTVAL